MSVCLLFPVHLYANIERCRHTTIYLIEEPRYFTDFSYHKLKIAYHRATMKRYFLYLKKNKCTVHYVDWKDCTSSFYSSLPSSKVWMYDCMDRPLHDKLKKRFPQIEIVDAFHFSMTPEIIRDNSSLFCDMEKRKMNHVAFYKFQRKRLQLYMDGNQPRGGQWSYDKDNRKKIPAHVTLPSFHPLRRTSVNQKIIQEAIDYTERHFPDNYGSLSSFVYPIDVEESAQWLNDFLQHRFKDFGIYEDAVTRGTSNPFLFHSGLSPMMNIGLLTEADVNHAIQPWEKKIPPSSYEGFLRQCIGWRNYIYTSYVLFGEEMRHSNLLNHTQRADSAVKHKLWNASTGLEPIDTIMQKINQYAYAHHIERLMYLGNFLSYCSIHPLDVYTLFMEWTLDAYDWVMIPNVMGMSQYACGNTIMNRPYMCSSNYILNMSDYKKGEWSIVWDSLYYHYIEKHQKILKANYASSRQVSFWNKKSASEKRRILARAQEYIRSFTNQKVKNDHGHEKQKEKNNGRNQNVRV